MYKDIQIPAYAPQPVYDRSPERKANDLPQTGRATVTIDIKNGEEKPETDGRGVVIIRPQK